MRKAGHRKSGGADQHQCARDLGTRARGGDQLQAHRGRQKDQHHQAVEGVAAPDHHRDRVGARQVLGRRVERGEAQRGADHQQDGEADLAAVRHSRGSVD
jgi:hypothetical protein